MDSNDRLPSGVSTCASSSANNRAQDGRLRAGEHGQAKLEGLLEGLREAIAGRKDAA